mgnify:CR=1 FL=1
MLHHLLVAKCVVRGNKILYHLQIVRIQFQRLAQGLDRLFGLTYHDEPWPSRPIGAYTSRPYRTPVAKSSAP